MVNGPERPVRSLRQIFQYLVRRHFWRSTIAWSAWIDATALVDRTYPQGVVVQDDVWIGPYVVVLTHDMSRRLYLTTTIERGATIGARSLIMPGVTVGAGAMVAPGSVVSADVPPAASVAGNPARPQRVVADAA
jgi:acetyltransferase-like isoleucine patch superfamily enzyme